MLSNYTKACAMLRSAPLYTLRTVHQKNIVCDRTHLVAFLNKDAAQRTATILQAPRTYVSSTACHLDLGCNSSGLKAQFEQETRPQLVRYGIGPEHLSFLTGRAAQMIVHKGGLSDADSTYKLVAQPDVSVEDIHMYTLFSLPVYEFKPIVIAGDLIQEKEDYIAFEALVVENSKVLSRAIAYF